MTREEASNILDDYDVNFDGHTAEEIAEAFDVAFRALEQEPILDRDCEHCSKTYGTLGCCTTVSNKWVYSCKEGQREYLLEKIRAEIDRQQKWLLHAGYTAYNVDIALDAIKSIVAD